MSQFSRNRTGRRGKLTLSERKFVEETGVDGNALSNEKVPVEVEDVLELPKG